MTILSTKTYGFHLSIGVKSMEETIDFYVRILKGRVAHRDPSGYVNIDLYGCELTLKPNETINADIQDFHFGINFDLKTFEELAEWILRSGYSGIVMKPKTFDGGTAIERTKMYVKCPTGYIVELKGYPVIQDATQ